MKVFIIMEIGWEYNDENYYRPEDEGGIPNVAYESKIAAQSACYEMNIIKMKENDSREGITQYFEVKEVELVSE